MTDREAYLEKRRRYYQSNKEKWSEYAKNNRDKINAYWRKKRAEDPEKYREYRNEWRKNNAEKAREYSSKYHHSEKGQDRYKRYYSENKDDFFRRAKASRDKYKHESRARNIVSRAIHDGKLLRQPCCICGDSKTDAHHDDYNKPLDVRWMCRRCHIKWHKENEPVRFSEEVWCEENGIDTD